VIRHAGSLIEFRRLARPDRVIFARSVFHNPQK
jgi:hypothetical protein